MSENSHIKRTTCLKCNYIIYSETIPEKCRICHNSSSGFEALAIDLQIYDLTIWKCMNCGYIHKGTSPPDNCPVCNAPGERFEPGKKI